MILHQCIDRIITSLVLILGSDVLLGTKGFLLEEEQAIKFVYF